jgi:transcriptional regulator with XRE-family HTH domain
MKSSEIIKEIRTYLNLSQSELADTLGVSFATVNRWEKGRCEPSQIAVNAIKNLRANNKIDFTQFEGNHIISSNEIVTLYHGSKSGIRGSIAPISRERCDFGKGFYMGTERTQPLTLICNFPDARIYTLSVNLSGLKILDVEVGLDWALLVAYNRGKMESVKHTTIYNRFANLSKDCDMIIGYIANDRMFVVLDRFFNGEITDTALINSLSALKFGKQYVALTEKACKKIKILDEQVLSGNDRDKLKQESEANRSKGIAMADEICRKYRRDGRFFDEILKAGE